MGSKRLLVLLFGVLLISGTASEQSGTLTTTSTQVPRWNIVTSRHPGPILSLSSDYKIVTLYQRSMDTTLCAPSGRCVSMLAVAAWIDERSE